MRYRERRLRNIEKRLYLIERTLAVVKKTLSKCTQLDNEDDALDSAERGQGGILFKEILDRRGDLG